MKVILKQDVNKVGRMGDLVDVADGYGRNYLVGRGLGEEATPGKLREFQEAQKTRQLKDAKKLKLAEEAKKKIGGKVVPIKVNAGEGGKLFGSVTSAQVADAVKARYGVAVDKKDIKLDDSIKQAGDYAFKIRLCAGVEAEMTLKVETE